MNQVLSDAVYFARRAQQSHQAADDAVDKGSAGIHASLELAYDRLSRTSEEQEAPTNRSKIILADAGEEWENEGGAGLGAALRAS